ncbi:molybdopterin molybdotransferase MoeA [Aquipuribacter sp. MA13-6]|uniref:molybdopterin molybdotransferase MoeA n=1 Tax=unclassified Aquipuribacter TaxID=2635084 RepID=UPI003EED7270
MPTGGRDHGPGASVEQARDRARRLGASRLLPATESSVAAAPGSVLAEPLLARSDVPAADASAMDGFAVAGPGPWRVRGRVLAGGVPAAPVAAGDAVEVATGALVPLGTERVLPVEVVETAAGVLRLVEEAPGRRHVRPRGEECSAGEVLLEAGRLVTASVAGLAASTGTDSLLVRRPPQVRALVTGDEILTSGLPVPGQVRDAVGPLLPDAVRVLGGRLGGLDRCGDGAGELDAALDGMLRSDADVLLTCGMAGSGPADRLRPWLAQVGARLVVDGVAVRPGHPQVLAELPDGRPLVGLPGNPLAAVAALLVLLRPLLAGMTGTAELQPARALLVGWEQRGRPVSSLVPVRHTGAGQVEPSGPAGPAQLRGLAAADAVALVPAAWDPSTPVELLPRP